MDHDPDTALVLAKAARAAGQARVDAFAKAQPAHDHTPACGHNHSPPKGLPMGVPKPKLADGVPHGLSPNPMNKLDHQTDLAKRKREAESTKRKKAARERTRQNWRAYNNYP